MKNILMIVIGIGAALIVMAPDALAVTITDNFTDMEDLTNPTWTHLSGDAMSMGQTWDATTGEYRIAAPSNGVTLGGNQYGFAGSYVAPSYTDVNVSADLVQPSTGVAYGVAARLNGNNAFNALQGYGYVFEQDLAAPTGTGEMVMTRINGLNITDIGNDGPAVRMITLDPNKDYTVSLSIIGNTLYGNVTEVGGGVVAFQQKTDSAYASGFSGVFGYGARSTTLPLEFPLNFTVDNFRTQEVPEPASALLTALGIGALISTRRRRANVV
jgi:hypothetical protein